MYWRWSTMFFPSRLLCVCSLQSLTPTFFRSSCILLSHLFLGVPLLLVPMCLSASFEACVMYTLLFMFKDINSKFVFLPPNILLSIFIFHLFNDSSSTLFYRSQLDQLLFYKFLVFYFLYTYFFI